MLEYTDSYKLSHKGFMNEGTTAIYSNFTPRTGKHFPVLKDRWDNKVVVFGVQSFIKEVLIDEWNTNFFRKPKDQVIGEYKRLFDFYLGKDVVPTSHFEQLHDFGYLPLSINCLPEGSLCPIGVPILTVYNTHPDFAWLTNYIETVMSCELWKPMTVATIIREYRRLVNDFAMKTTGSTAGTEFQIHGFEFRGMSGRHDAAKCGAAFLLSTCGTDTIPALPYLEKYYGVNIENEFIATSVPASEHSIASLGTSVEGELESYRKWITKDYPTGIVSLVSDTYDFWRVVTEYATELKDDILNRQPNELGLAKVVFRPDSGDPVKIICGEGSSAENMAAAKGAVECLWDVFGGTVNEQGYKVLHERVGLIYGDSITLERANAILKGLEQKGFASTNVVFGVGSYTCQHLTRDSLGMAVKATYAEVNGESHNLFKDPVTDDGTKKSAKGLLQVVKKDDTFVLIDEWDGYGHTEHENVFINGVLVNPVTFSQIRSKLWNE